MVADGFRVKGNPGANMTVLNITFRDIVVVDVDLVFDIAMHYACQNTSGTQNYNDCAAAQGEGGDGSIQPYISGVRYESVSTQWCELHWAQRESSCALPA